MAEKARALPDLSAIWRRPLDAPLLTRAPVRLLMVLARRRVVGVTGTERLLRQRDPFLLAVSHSNRLETLLLPAILILLRGGRQVRFLADWPMMLVPLVGLLYRRSRVIVVGTKTARPPFLNVLRPLYARGGSAYDQALAALAAGDSVGIYPEGTMNRQPSRLLRGRHGAARLALSSGTPVIPTGIRFPEHRGDRPIGDLEPLTIHFGEPLEPTPSAGPAPTLAEVRAFHGRLMRRIAHLSGKSWNPKADRRNNDAARKLDHRLQSRGPARPFTGAGGAARGLPRREGLDLGPRVAVSDQRPGP